MDCYFIDCENIGKGVLKNICNISNGDCIHFFYGISPPSIPINVYDEAGKKGIQFVYHKAVTGEPNALDFQLSAYLGYVIGTSTDKSISFYILSKDKGYDCLIKFWAEHNHNVKRITDFSLAASKKNSSENRSNAVNASKAKKTKKSKVSLEDIRLVINDDETAIIVSEIINMSSSKNEVSVNINKHYRDSKKTSEIYKKVKPLLKNMK